MFSQIDDPVLIYNDAFCLQAVATFVMNGLPVVTHPGMLSDFSFR